MLTLFVAENDERTFSLAVYWRLKY